jgi:hypothetical protein
VTWLDVLDELGRENLRWMPRRPSVPWINAVWKVNDPTHRRRPHVKLISVRVGRQLVTDPWVLTVMFHGLPIVSESVPMAFRLGRWGTGVRCGRGCVQWL